MNCKGFEIFIPFERYLDKLLNQLLFIYYGVARTDNTKSILQRFNIETQGKEFRHRYTITLDKRR